MSIQTAHNELNIVSFGSAILIKKLGIWMMNDCTEGYFYTTLGGLFSIKGGDRISNDILSAEDVDESTPQGPFFAPNAIDILKYLGRGSLSLKNGIWRVVLPEGFSTLHSDSTNPAEAAALVLIKTEVNKSVKSTANNVLKTTIELFQMKH